MKKKNTIFKMLMLALIFAIGVQVATINVSAEPEKTPEEIYADELDKLDLVAIILRLDNKSFSGQQFYYSKKGVYYNESIDDYIHIEQYYEKYPSDEEYADRVFVELTESSVYAAKNNIELPECPYTGALYLAKKSTYVTDDNYFHNGNFYLYKPDETEVGNRIESYSNGSGTKEIKFSNNVCELDLYTVSFEEGNVETMELPSSFVQKKGKLNTDKCQITYPDSNWYPFYLNRSDDKAEAGGYAFDCWKNSNDTKMEYGSTVSEPTVLHPVFINQDDVENYHGTKVKVESGAELVEKWYDDEKQMLIVDKEIIINLDACGEYGNKSSYREGFVSISYRGSYYKKDMILIKDGGNLVLDNVGISCYVNNGTNRYDAAECDPITIQNGGVLKLQNTAEINYGWLAVQPNGKIEVDSSCRMELNSLHNYGQISMKKASDATTSDKHVVQVTGIFFNASTGKINDEYGIFEITPGLGSGQGDDCWKKGNVGNMHHVTKRNMGTMTFTGESRLDISAHSNSSYQHDFNAQLPFINYGKIETSTNADAIYEKYPVVIQNATMYNYGTMNIKCINGTQGEIIHLSQTGGGIKMYSARLFNNGTINLDVQKGTGLYIDHLFYNPEESKGLNQESLTCSQKQYSTLTNYNKGIVNVKTNKNTIGIWMGQDVELNNEGKITFEFNNASETKNNYSLVLAQHYNTNLYIDPTVNNNGSIVNNGCFVHTRDGVEPIWNGNAFTGTGKMILLPKNEEQDDPVVDPIDPNNQDNPSGNGNTGGGSSQTPTTQAPTPAPATQTSVAEGGSIDSTNSSDKFSTYTVTSSDATNPEVAYTGSTDKKATKVTVPSTVTSNGVTYKVTSIEDNAFKGNTKLTSVTISANLEEIGNNVFSGCSSLKSVTLPAKVSKIGNNAFKGCKKLKTLTIKSTKLTKKSISKNAFKGITTKTTIKVPKKMKKAYTKLFRKKGLNKKVKVAGM